MRIRHSMRMLVVVSCCLLGGCSVLYPDLYGRPEFKRWMQKALMNPKKDGGTYRFSLAYHGNPAGLRAYFQVALLLANSSEVNLLSGESLAYEMETLVRHLGDQRFSQALSAEPPEVQSAVACFLYQPGLTRYPKTVHLLQSAPKVDFPMLRAYRAGTVAQPQAQ
jgi:hypothetical protein